MREPPPTMRQIEALCRALMDEAGRPWPGTRAEASALITRVRAGLRDRGRPAGARGGG